jgi:excisionase family DNA binding protein
MTLYEAAESLGVHYMTVYRYVRTGRLPGRKVGVEWRVDPADLDRFAATTDAGPSIPATMTPRRRVDYQQRLVERLTDADEPGAWSIVQSALGAGIEPQDLYLDVISPALTVIGDEWAADRLTIGQEHQASVIVLRLLGRLGPLFARRGRKRGTVVIGAPAGDHHSLPSALFADLLRGIGLAVIDLGADTPAQSFVADARRAERLVAVAISATSPGDEPAITDTVTALRSAVEVPIVLGGHAVDSEARSVALGADHWAPDARQALALFAELADDASQARRRATRQSSYRASPTEAP